MSSFDDVCAPVVGFNYDIETSLALFDTGARHYLINGVTISGDSVAQSDQYDSLYEMVFDALKAWIDCDYTCYGGQGDFDNNIYVVFSPKALNHANSNVTLQELIDQKPEFDRISDMLKILGFETAEAEIVTIWYED